ncbi:uncharacterized protein ACB058_000162 isoform 3-T3 [Synchiropus picturatus]
MSVIVFILLVFSVSAFPWLPSPATQGDQDVKPPQPLGNNQLNSTRMNANGTDGEPDSRNQSSIAVFSRGSCVISLCPTLNLGDRMQEGGDEIAGDLTSDSNGYGKK